MLAFHLATNANATQSLGHVTSRPVAPSALFGYGHQGAVRCMHAARALTGKRKKQTSAKGSSGVQKKRSGAENLVVKKHQQTPGLCSPTRNLESSEPPTSPRNALSLTGGSEMTRGADTDVRAQELRLS